MQGIINKECQQHKYRTKPQSLLHEKHFGRRFYHNGTDPRCAPDITADVLQKWKENFRVVCQGKGNVRIEEYVLEDWEFTPTVYRYINAQAAESMGAPLLGTGCNESTTKVRVRGQEKATLRRHHGPKRKRHPPQ